jgi:hypothetical protein
MPHDDRGYSQSFEHREHVFTISLEPVALAGGAAPVAVEIERRNRKILSELAQLLPPDGVIPPSAMNEEQGRLALPRLGIIKLCLLDSHCGH